MKHLWIALAGVALLGACAQSNRSAAVGVNSSGDVSGGVAVESTSPRNSNVSTTVAVVFQAYPTTLFGYWVWNRLLIRYPLSTTAPLTLLVPVFALVSGYFMYDEVLGSAQILACVLFFVGIGLIVKPSGKGQALSRYSPQVSKT